MQYGRTKGIVHHLIARNLAVDERITVDPEAIVVTVGCQEAMFLVLRALRAEASDVLFAVAPTYVGLTGAARLVDLPVRPVAGGPDGVDLADLRAGVRRARAEGLRPRACYVMPDFANPSGVSMDTAQRRRLLDLAAEEDLLLIEDNPYGLFPATGTDRRPTLKALDTARRVVYLGSFAKTVLPGARVGYVVADQRVGGSDGTVGPLADQLAKIKSMVTVNTSPISQAVIGGALLAHDCSLVAANVRERAAYARNLGHLVAGLARRFPAGGPVRWTVPAGGFFVVVTVPFRRRRAAASSARSTACSGPRRALLRRRAAPQRPAALLQPPATGRDRGRPRPPRRLRPGPAGTPPRAELTNRRRIRKRRKASMDASRAPSEQAREAGAGQYR